MIDEQKTDYAYKDDLIRNYINLIIHEALKLQPSENYDHRQNAASRITNVFFELLERQFPIESTDKPLQLKSAQDYAKELSVHPNYLNRAVKEVTGKPTTSHIKAVATTSMYDMSRVMAKGYYDKLTIEERTKMLEQMGEQRWKDAEKETSAPGNRNLPEKLQGNELPFVKEYFDYYRTSRGFHPRSLNSNGAWTATNAVSFMNMPLLTYIKEIAPRPVLLIAGENAHSRYFSEDAYKAAAAPKELLIIPKAVHVDLYDKIDIIPFDKLTAFFTEHLKGGKGSKSVKVEGTGKTESTLLTQ